MLSTRAKLLIFFCSLSALGMLAFATLWLYGVPALGVEGIASNEKRRAIEAVEALADRERDQIEHWFGERRGELRLFAEGEASSALVAGAARGRESIPGSGLQRSLQRLAAASRAYDALYVATADGRRVMVASTGTLVEPPGFQRAVLDEAVAPGMVEFIGLATGAAGPELVLANQIGGKDKAGDPDGSVLGILVATIPLLAPFREERTALWQSVGESGAVLLIDRDGVVLGSQTASGGEAGFGAVGRAAEAGSEGVKLLADESGHELIVVYRHLHLGGADGLSLAVLRRADDALAASRGAFWRIVSLALLGLLGSFLLVGFAAQRVARSEREIRDLNASLEQRVEQRTSELAAANQELKETLQHLQGTRDDLERSERLAALGSLVAGVAHELSTPLGNALLAASSLNDAASDFSQQLVGGIKRSALDKHVAENLEGLGLLTANLQRAAELLGGFKQVAVDQTSDQRRQFDLASVVQDVAIAMQPPIRRRAISLHVDVPSGIRMDSYPGPLGRVLVNFVTNALIHAYTETDRGAMRISAHALANDHVELVFADDGAGMSAEVCRRVFEPFFTTRLGQGGSGLGMHIVYNIVIGLLGGQIRVESAPGEGAAFHLVLPKTAPLLAAGGEST